MTVRYVRVKPFLDPSLFAPAVRATGNVAIVGRSTAPVDAPKINVPILFTDPAEARSRVPGELGDAIALAFNQSPGPTVVYAVRVDSAAPDWSKGLDALATVDVQLIALAKTPTAATGAVPGAVGTLAEHVNAVSETGGDGKERMGVAMLPKGIVEPPAGTLPVSDRMVYIAHKSDQDAAAAVAGVIAGQPPHVSLLLKQVNIISPPFSSSEILKLNGDETFDSGPAAKFGINWLTSPSLIPGQGVYMGEGYTGNAGPGGKRYIDVQRCMDDVTFRLKAKLIGTVGNLRISRSGLRAMVAQMETVLDPLVRGEVIEGYQIVVPLLTLLDKPPALLTPGELSQINLAQTQRLVPVLTAVDYAGALQRISISLKFD